MVFVLASSATPADTHDNDMGWEAIVDRNEAPLLHQIENKILTSASQYDPRSTREEVE